MTLINYIPLGLMYFKITMPWSRDAAALSLLVNTNTGLLRKLRGSLNISGGLSLIKINWIKLKCQNY